MMHNSEIKWVKLGEFICPRNERNNDLKYDAATIEGVTSNGQFEKTKAITEGINLKPYKIIRKGDFVYNPSRLNIGSLSYRDTDKLCIVSHLYVVFVIKDEFKTKLLPEYLLIWFNRSEFRRAVDYYNYGSQRAEFNIHDISELTLPVPYRDGEPDLERQREVVAVWQGLRRLKEDNEAIAKPLLEICQAKLEELKHSAPMVQLGEFIEQCDSRNTDGLYKLTSVRGLSTSKNIITTKANMEGVPLTSYKIMRPLDIAYVADTSRRGGRISLALNESNENYLLSSISIIFRTKDATELNPTFLYLWLCRSEFDRYARFNSWGSARESFSWAEMCRVKIPKPAIDVQRAIVDLYQCARRAQEIAQEADNQLKTICPALVQHIINT